VSKCQVKYCREPAAFDFPPRHPEAIGVCDRHFVVLSYIDGTKVMNRINTGMNPSPEEVK
jgi:hypothetical protein